jgi:hypothetical protein
LRENGALERAGAGAGVRLSKRVRKLAALSGRVTPDLPN